MKTVLRLLAWTTVPLAGYLFLVFVLGPTVRPSPEGPNEAPEEVTRDYYQSVPRDAILPVYDPTFLPASEATLQPDELVIGVALEGEARAYPVGFLNFREMVNDRIGPDPLPRHLVTDLPYRHRV